MKKRKIITGLLLASVALGLASCDNSNKEPVEPPVTEKEDITVTFEVNGGSAINKLTIKAGDKVTKPADPTKEDYIFSGWYSDANCTISFDFTKEITTSTTIYAKWTAVATYTITFNVDGGSEVAPITVKDGKLATRPDDPIKQNCLFAGWFNGDSQFDFTQPITSNLELTAHWTLESRTVSFDSTGGSTVDPVSIGHGNILTAPTAPTKTGYVFDGWLCGDELYDFTQPVTSNITLTARWILDAPAISMNGTEYDTIAEALAAIPTNSTDTFTIRLNKGTYTENGLTYNGSATIKISGNTNEKYGSDVIIKGHGSKMPGETGCDSRNRCLISIQGTANIILENLTLESDWYRADHSGDVQAEVLGTDTKGYTAAYNCGFKSHQDTLRTTGKAWFYKCYVEGDVDFMWMEAGGTVALYEECEIVSVYDASAGTHNTYITAPKMAETVKLGKGLVIYNSTVRESDEARANGQKTYLARTPWTSGCYNQVAYINTMCEDIEISDGPWYKQQIETIYEKTSVGWKMDQFTANSIGIQGTKDYILNDDTVSVEFNGRKSILNRLYDTGKLRYVTDSINKWDIDSFISENNWKVTNDSSSDTLANDTLGEAKVYYFDGSEDNSSLCNGFALETGKTHYRGGAGATITIPLNGKCYVEVYGYWSGTAEIVAGTQGESIMFFNNATTNSEVQNDYIIYDENAESLVITAKDMTYITKIAVIKDSSIEYKKVESIGIASSTPKDIVGVSKTLTATINPKGVTNSTVKWTSSNSEVATIDEYTGKVTFLKAGQVVFTATARDGSGVTKTITCNPIVPTWTEIEWYTTDTDVVNESSAKNIDMFDTNNSTNKSIGTEYKFTNLSGNEIKTKYGLKLNSTGKLSFATLKYAEVTLIVAPKQNYNVLAPTIKNADGSVAKLISSQVDETTKLQTFKYELTSTGMWDIERYDVTMENNPIIYAKVEYKTPVISESTGITFKGTYYTEAKTGIADIFTPGSAIDATNSTIQLNKMSLTNCKSNGNLDNWLTFNTGASIEFKVDKACTLLVGYYSKLQTVKLDGEVVTGNKTSVANGTGEIVEYEISGAGTVTIEATTNNYLGFVGVVFRTLEERKVIACNNLDASYPASKYTQNADYQTTLTAQKAAINAATDDAALAAAIAAAKTAMDALEVDVATGPVGSLYYNFQALTNKPADGSAVESTSEITFAGCVAHQGKYVALKENNTVKITLAKDAILTVNMPYSSGVKINNNDVTLDSNENLVYKATAEGEVIITGAAGGAYITTITVVTPVEQANVVILGSNNKDLADALGTNILQGSTVVYENFIIDASASGAKFALNGGDNVQFNTGTKITFNVKAGAKVTVCGYPGNFAYSLDGVEATSVDTVKTYTEDATVTILATDNKYLKSIKVEYPIEQTTNTILGSNNKDLANALGSSGKVEGSILAYENFIIDASASGAKFSLNGGDNVQFNTGTKITFNVKAGAKVTVCGYPGNFAYSLDGVEATSVDTVKTYTEDTTVIILATNNKYLKSIMVECPITQTTATILGSNNKNLANALGSSGKIEGSTMLYGNYIIDASASGAKFALNGGDNVQFNTGTKITFNVKAGAKVTVCGYPGNFAYSLDGVEATSVDTVKIYTENATVTILSTGNKYLKSIRIEYPIEQTINTILGLNNQDLTNVLGSSKKVEGAVIAYNNFIIDASASGAKFALNGGDNVQFNTGTKITFVVKVGAKVTVCGYPGNFAYSLDGVEATSVDTVKTYTEDSIVTILANGNQYLKSINVEYPTE